MSPVMMSLELLLAALLVATLLFGLRLERRLRALREAQAGFVKAMSELDGAAHRTETGLERLRSAAEDARDDLGPRIQAAEAAAARLERITAEAEEAALRAEQAAQAVQESARTLARVVPTSRPAPGPRPAPEIQGTDAKARLAASDFAAMLAHKPAEPAPHTTRQPLPSTRAGEAQSAAAPSRLRQAAALLRGG
jgi:hypothetical protein